MAEHILNNSTEFFYSNNDSFSKLFEELDTRFSYQKVVVVGESENLSKFYDCNYRQANFTMIFASNFKYMECDDSIVAVICVDAKNLEFCRQYCYKYKKFLVVVASDYVPLSYFIHKENFANILGVVIDKTNVLNKLDDFKINLAFDYTEIIFDETENLLVDLFFNKKYNFEAKNANFDMFFSNICGNFESVMNQYSLLIEYFVNKQYNILNNLLDKKSDKNGFEKLVMIEILFNIYKIFVERINPSLKRVMNTNDLKLTNEVFQNYIYFYETFDENKFWFIKHKFYAQIKCFIEKKLIEIEKIKRLCFLINIDQMYDKMKNCHLEQQRALDNFKFSIKLSALDFNQNCFLKVINHFGYLDF